MNVATRKPLAPAIHIDRSRERCDVRRTFRLTETEDLAYREGAVAERVDLSTYLRDCLATGHSLKQAQRLVRRTGA